MKYANINTGEIKDSLPAVMVNAAETITGANIAHWAKQGWREVKSIAVPDTGYRVGTYRVNETGPLTCTLAVATSINIADESAFNAAALAAQLADQLAATKALVKTLAAGGTNLSSITPEAVARLVLACQTVNVTWLMQIAPRVIGSPQKTGSSYLEEIESAVNAQT